MKVIKRHRPASGPYLERATERLLGDVPGRILAVALIEDRGLVDGLAIIERHWRDRVARGELRAVSMEASIVPLAALLSAALTAYLRGTPIAARQEVFEELLAVAGGALAGTPDRILIAGGIV